MGGLLTVWLEREFLAGHFGLPAAVAWGGFADVPAWLSWTLMAVFFIPGGLAGGFLGWLVIGPVNRVLGWCFRKFNHYFDRMSSGYAYSVGGLLRVCIVVLVVYGGLLALTYVAFQKAPTGFIPQQDQGRLIANIQLPDSASLAANRSGRRQDRRRSPGATPTTANTTPASAASHTSWPLRGVRSCCKPTAPTSPRCSSSSTPSTSGKKPELRDTAIMNSLSKACAEKVPEALFTVLGASPIPGLGTAGGFKFVVEDRGDLGLEALQKQTEGLIRKLKKVPGLSRVTTQFRAKTPQLFLDIDRDKVASLGVSLNDVNQTLGIFMGSSYVNSFNDFGRHWQVTLQADGSYRNRVEDLNLFQVRNSVRADGPAGHRWSARRRSSARSRSRVITSTPAPP